MPAQPRALVTGATGFVGSRLVWKLVADGWDVHVLLRPSSRPAALQPVLGSIRTHAFDIAAPDATPLVQVMEAARPDVIFHLASYVASTHRPQDVHPMVEANVTFPALLVDAAAASGVRRFVNTGTSWTHFENRDYEPVCLYAATKKAFEDILEYYVAATSLRAVNLELFDTFGPRDPRSKVINLLRDAARQDKLLDLSPGEQLIDLVYIDDVIEAYLLAASRLAEGLVQGLESYAVASGKPLTIKELVRLYEQATGRRVPVRWGGRAYREREVMTPWNRGRLLPGWTPRIEPAEGIRRIESAEGAGL